MTDAIDELERLHAAATGGTWRLLKEDDCYAILHPANEGETIAFCPQDTGRKQKSCAAFIVASHNHLPALLATLREMRAALEWIGSIHCREWPDHERSERFGHCYDKARAALDAARARLNGGK